MLAAAALIAQLGDVCGTNGSSRHHGSPVPRPTNDVGSVDITSLLQVSIEQNSDAVRTSLAAPVRTQVLVPFQRGPLSPWITGLWSPRNSSALEGSVRRQKRRNPLSVILLAALQTPIATFTSEASDGIAKVKRKFITSYADDDDKTSTQKVLTQPVDHTVKLIFILCSFCSFGALAVTWYCVRQHWLIGCRMSASAWPHDKAARYIMMFAGVPLFAASGWLSLLTLDLHAIWQTTDGLVLVLSMTNVLDYLQGLAGGPFSLQKKLDAKFWSGEQYKGHFLTQAPCCFLRLCVSSREPTMQDVVRLRSRFFLFRVGIVGTALLTMVLGMEDKLGVTDSSDAVRNTLSLIAVLDTVFLVLGVSSMGGMVELVEAICPNADFWHFLFLRGYILFTFSGLRLFPKFLAIFPFHYFADLEWTLSNGYTLEEDELEDGASSVMVCLASFGVALAACLAFPVNETTYPDVYGKESDNLVFTVDRIKHCPFCGNSGIKYSTEKQEAGEEAPPQAYMAGVDTFDCPKCENDCIPLEVHVRRQGSDQ